ncbi:SURF1 family protein [Herbaspirillum sp. RTI4]|uniref:SURF1 family protein n=1 Tax=Herbaspirillum sp. RTI4 TaxID=3048640 RepID=UPI002AB55788|nr:SURF1 family protein [Herbaspirillum sp. RTI4]MDY7577702.1 SURF1 family protein [Herbaspirillum sp. RTI4]MEA9980870.1 SURF1 family protein [Herbaspirillum sp. RTI4]
MQIRFRFRWVPFIATVMVASLGVSLAQWQARRAEQKQSIESKLSLRQHIAPVRLAQANLPPTELEYRRVLLRGAFLPAWTMYLDNRPYNGQAGFYVLTPFKLEGVDRVVTVERGWVPRNPVDRTRLPTTTPVSGQVEIEGTVRSDTGHVMQLGAAPPLQPGAILQNLDVDALAKASGLPLLPLVVQQAGDAADGLVRDWPAPSLGIERHRGYEFQWYALAAMAILFFVVTGFRRGSK